MKARPGGGTSPLVVALGAWFLAHEHLGLLAIAGVLVLASGLLSLAVSGGRLLLASQAGRAS